MTMSNLTSFAIGLHIKVCMVINDIKIFVTPPFFLCIWAFNCLVFKYQIADLNKKRAIRNFILVR
jgi:hypothetical protein